MEEWEESTEVDRLGRANGVFATVADTGVPLLTMVTMVRRPEVTLVTISGWSWESRLSIRSSRRAGDVWLSVSMALAEVVAEAKEEVVVVEDALEVELMATQDPGSSLAWCDGELDSILKAASTRATYHHKRAAKPPSTTMGKSRRGGGGAKDTASTGPRPVAVGSEREASISTPPLSKKGVGISESVGRGCNFLDQEFR